MSRSGGTSDVLGICWWEIRRRDFQDASVKLLSRWCRCFLHPRRKQRGGSRHEAHGWRMWLRWLQQQGPGRALWADGSSDLLTSVTIYGFTQIDINSSKRPICHLKISFKSFGSTFLRIWSVLLNWSRSVFCWATCARYRQSFNLFLIFAPHLSPQLKVARKHHSVSRVFEIRHSTLFWGMCFMHSHHYICSA